MARKIRGHGEGSIHQRSSGSWRAQISNGGKRFGKSFKKKSDAQAWLRKMQNKLEMGADHEGGKVTLEVYLPRWLENKRAAISPKHAYHYEQLIRDHIVPYIGEIRLKDLRLSRVEKLYTDLLKLKVGRRTIGMTHAVLRGALGKAVQYGLIGKNPASSSEVPKYSHTEMKILDANQANLFLNSAQNSSYKALYYMAILTGMREGELFGLFEEV